MQFRRFLEDNRDKLREFKPCLESPFLGWRDLFSRRMLKLLPTLRPWLSLDQELGRYFSDPRIRLAFSFQSKYLGMSPYRCPSLFSILSFLEYEHGVYHPIGGCGAVTDAMARIAREMGVEIRLGEEAREILFEGRKAVGVRTDRRGPRRRRPGHQRRLRPGDDPPGARRLAPAVDGPANRPQAILLLDVHALPGNRRAATTTWAITPSTSTRTTSGTCARSRIDHVLSESPSFYVQNACVTDPSLAPPGMSTLYVLVPVTHQHPNVDWSRERERFRALVLARLAKVGINDLESRIRFEHMITPADWDQSYEIHRGATFNLAHNLSQMLHLRPRNRFEDLEVGLSRRRGHPPGERSAGHLRIRPHHLPASGRRPGYALPLLEAKRSQQA